SRTGQRAWAMKAAFPLRSAGAGPMRTGPHDLRAGAVCCPPKRIANELYCLLPAIILRCPALGETGGGFPKPGADLVHHRVIGRGRMDDRGRVGDLRRVRHQRETPLVEIGAYHALAEIAAAPGREDVLERE